jgi:hypothetical protein
MHIPRQYPSSSGLHTFSVPTLLDGNARIVEVRPYVSPTVHWATSRRNAHIRWPRGTQSVAVPPHRFQCRFEGWSKFFSASWILRTIWRNSSQDSSGLTLSVILRPCLEQFIQWIPRSRLAHEYPELSVESLRKIRISLTTTLEAFRRSCHSLPYARIQE